MASASRVPVTEERFVLGRYAHWPSAQASGEQELRWRVEKKSERRKENWADE